jgi:hypothetical protein
MPVAWGCLKKEMLVEVRVLLPGSCDECLRGDGRAYRIGTRAARILTTPSGGRLWVLWLALPSTACEEVGPTRKARARQHPLQAPDQCTIRRNGACRRPYIVGFGVVSPGKLRETRPRPSVEVVPSVSSLWLRDLPGVRVSKQTGFGAWPGWSDLSRAKRSAAGYQGLAPLRGMH